MTKFYKLVSKLALSSLYYLQGMQEDTERNLFLGQGCLKTFFSFGCVEHFLQERYVQFFSGSANLELSFQDYLAFGSSEFYRKIGLNDFNLQFCHERQDIFARELFLTRGDRI